MSRTKTRYFEPLKNEINSPSRRGSSKTISQVAEPVRLLLGSRAILALGELNAFASGAICRSIAFSLKYLKCLVEPTSAAIASRAARAASPQTLEGR
jgi:hypothetical protein